jgi:hypothetical protein
MTMTSNGCEEYRRRFSEYVEDELTTEARRDLEAHLRACRLCPAELEAFRRTLEALRDLPPAVPPPDLAARIDRALTARGKRRGRTGSPRWARPAVAALLVAAFGLASLRLLPAGPDRETPAKQRAPRFAHEERRARVESEHPPGAADRAAPVPSMREESARAPAGGDLAAEKAAPGARPSGGEATEARALLLAPRANAAWATEVLAFVRARPVAIAAAWQGMDGEARARALEAWRRGAAGPEARAEIAGILERSPAPEARALLEALRDATR